MYYLSRNGTQSGPFDEAQWQQMLISGQVQPTDLYWKEGTPDWRPASEAMRAAPPPMPPPPMGQQQAWSPYQAPATPIQQVYTGRTPETYLWQSIVVTILCCWPTGIPAIVYAASVNGKASAGDYAGAKVASDKARFWCWVSFWCVLVPVLFVLLTGGIAGFANYK